MGKGITYNPTKLANIVTWLQKSRTAWSIKDLEKQLPSIASINGMQVKDYLQNLSDDSRIKVEKIGSGNWYWSFASDELKSRQAALEAATAAHGKQLAINTDLDEKIRNAKTARADDDEDDEDRAELEERRACLETVLVNLRREISSYRDTDPAEIERKGDEVKTWRLEAEAITDDIYSMESYFKGSLGFGVEQIASLRETFYGAELDEDEGMLRELE